MSGSRIQEPQELRNSPPPSITSSTTLNSHNKSSRSILKPEEGSSSHVPHVAAGMEDMASAGRSSEQTNETTLNGSLRVPNASGTFRRHRPRSSGGFLLETAFIAPIDGSPEQERLLNKGKERANPVSHHQHNVSRTLPPTGSSPLSIEMKRPAVDGTDEKRQDPRNRDSIVVQRRRPHAKNPLQPNGRPAGGLSQGVQLEEEPSTSTGIDTDTLQIVNLALNLNQSRRRASNAARLSSLPPATGNRRVVSATIPTIGTAYGDGSPGNALRQYMQQQRRASRNISPTPDRVNRGGSASNRLASGQRALSVSQQVVKPEGTDVHYHFSKSTLARAEKTKRAFELSWEYMRLLQYLPPLKPKRSSNIRAVTPGSPNSPDLSRYATSVKGNELGGRPYNPLQCIRNRKLRARERKTIDVESEGWGDLVNVRNWVDRIESEFNSSEARENNIVSLPPLSGAIVFEEEEPQTSPNAGQSRSRLPIIKRPRIDWPTTPAEFLADAYWTELGSNRHLVEDNRGAKLLSRELKIASPVFRVSPEIEKLPQSPLLRRLDSPVRTPESRRGSSSPGPSAAAGVIFSPLSNGDEKPRGRGLEKLQNALHHHHDHSGNGDSESGSRSRKFLESSLKLPPRKRDHSSSSSVSPTRKSIAQILPGLTLSSPFDDDSPETNREFSSNIGNLNLVNGDNDDNDDMFQDLAQDDKSSSRGRSARIFDTIKEPSRILKPFADGKKSKHRPQYSTDIDFGPRSSFEGFDSSVPNSPVHRPVRQGSLVSNGNGSSIMASVPGLSSREGSPASMRRQSSSRSRLPFLRLDRSKDDEAISENDFAIDRPGRLKRQESEDLETDAQSSIERSRASSPVKRLISRKTDEGLGKILRKSESRSSWRGSKADIKGDIKDLDSSKFRGVFKGGRIAELVGNEVSRVGEFIWKKDPPASSSAIASSNSSFISLPSDSDEEGDGFESAVDVQGSNEKERHISNARGITKRRQSRALDNFPTFKSPFTSEKIESRWGPFSGTDHVGRQQHALRERRKTARFSRLAPPPIDMSHVSSDTSPDFSRSQGGGSDSSPVERRWGGWDFPRKHARGSFDPHIGVRRASSGLNAILGTKSPSAPAATLNALLAEPNDKRPTLEGKRQLSISHHGMGVGSGISTKREMARVRALLISSGVKAQEIIRRANEVRDQNSKLIENITGQRLPEVSNSQKHVLAARLIAENIANSISELEQSARNFSSHNVENLYDRIGALNDNMSDKLTPAVRQSADDADDFGGELTTTHTLSVKRLNDAVDAMLRRRKRRVRWFRKTGYVLLEWALIGVMWFLWMVVVVFKTIRGFLRGIVNGVRWVLWL